MESNRESIRKKIIENSRNGNILLVLGMELLFLVMFRVPEIEMDQTMSMLVAIFGAGFGLSGFLIIFKQGVATETMGRVKELQKLPSKDRIGIIVEKMEMERGMAVGLIISVIGMIVQFKSVLFGMMMVTAGMLIIFIVGMFYSGRHPS